MTIHKYPCMICVHNLMIQLDSMPTIYTSSSRGRCFRFKRSKFACTVFTVLIPRCGYQSPTMCRGDEPFPCVSSPPTQHDQLNSSKCGFNAGCDCFVSEYSIHVFVMDCSQDTCIIIAFVSGEYASRKAHEQHQGTRNNSHVG